MHASEVHASGVLRHFDIRNSMLQKCWHARVHCNVACLDSDNAGPLINTRTYLTSFLLIESHITN